MADDSCLHKKVLSSESVQACDLSGAKFQNQINIKKKNIYQVKIKMLTPKIIVLYTILFSSICLPGSKFHQASALVEDVVEVVKLGKDIVSTLLETWNLVEQTNLGGDVELPFRNGKQKKILNRINEVSRKISTFEDDVCIQKRIS